MTEWEKVHGKIIKIEEPVNGKIKVSTDQPYRIFYFRMVLKLIKSAPCKIYIALKPLRKFFEFVFEFILDIIIVLFEIALVLALAIIAGSIIYEYISEHLIHLLQ